MNGLDCLCCIFNIRRCANGFLGNSALTIHSTGLIFLICLGNSINKAASSLETDKALRPGTKVFFVERNICIGCNECARWLISKIGTLFLLFELFLSSLVCLLVVVFRVAVFGERLGGGYTLDV